jgi:hypothetical protein
VVGRREYDERRDVFTLHMSTPLLRYLVLPELVIDVEAYTEVSAYLSNSIQRHPHRSGRPHNDVNRLDALSFKACQPARVTVWAINTWAYRFWSSCPFVAVNSWI